MDRSEASCRHTGLCPPTFTQRFLGEDCVHHVTRGGVSISPTCLDVLVQLVNEAIQLLAVLRLQLQSITGMDPLAQGAGGPKQPWLEGRRPSSQGSPPPGKLNPFLSPGWGPCLPQQTKAPKRSRLHQLSLSDPHHCVQSSTLATKLQPAPP